MSRNPPRDTRHITLARALHARLYVNVEGRIFAVGGQPAHEKLSYALRRQERRPTAAEAPTPHELGISACDSELSQHLLHCISRALNRWQKELDAEMRRRPAQRRRAVHLVRDYQEIERLAARLRGVRQWHAELAHGAEPSGAPFFLDPTAEAGLQTALREVAGQHPLPPLIAWQARVVYWLSGDCAAQRYLTAVTSLLDAYPEVSRREQVRGFQRAVAAWKHRSEREQIRNLLAEIAQHVQRLPPDVVRKGKLSSRLRGRTFPEHCDALLMRCAQLLLSDQLHRWHIVPAALAALAATDGSAAALPQRCFQAGAEKEDFAVLLRTIGKLGEQMGQPGYDALLAAIDQLPELPSEFEYGQLRQLLAQGSSPADAAWACEMDLLPDLTDSCLSIAAARRLSDAFASRGWSLNAAELSRLIGSIRQKKDLAPIDAWLAWLGSVSPRAFTPRMLKALGPAFWQMYLPTVQRHGWFGQLTPCLVPHRTKSPADASAWLERIAAYQQLAGKKAVIPKSLRKLMEHDDRRQRERVHLRRRLTTGTLDASAQSRLRWLENDGAAAAPRNSERFRRAAEEVFLLLGIEAQRAIARRLAEAKCREHLGELTSLLARDQLWNFAGWIEKMSAAERERLRMVIAARSRHGREYKRYLAENQAWMDQAAARGLDLAPWFAADPHMEAIGGRTMDIGVADDLHHIFLMGAYFDTCLGLGNCNELSVLTNACDANKQVVFMFIRDDAGQRQVVARQLIAISSDFKLLGYYCYMNWRHAEKSKREEGLVAMAAYCGRLAAQCRLELADQGTPEEINEHFWYDDGACEWSSAAKSACFIEKAVRAIDRNPLPVG